MEKPLGAQLLTQFTGSIRNTRSRALSTNCRFQCGVLGFLQAIAPKISHFIQIPAPNSFPTHPFKSMQPCSTALGQNLRSDFFVDLRSLLAQAILIPLTPFKRERLGSPLLKGSWVGAATLILEAFDCEWMTRPTTQKINSVGHCLIWR